MNWRCDVQTWRISGMKRVRTGLIIEVNYMSRLIDLSGKRFGRLVAIRPEGHSINGNIRWLCHCDCGNNAIVDGFELRRGTTKSCGCLRREVMKKQYQENPVMQKFKGRSSNLYDSKGVAYASIKRSKRNHSGVLRWKDGPLVCAAHVSRPLRVDEELWYVWRSGRGAPSSRTTVFG